ncbi:MAG: hypothetical protein NTV49_07025 [Kiritimatiellaeota bacterium]|nr:hypothetical protein [Kiritimatiellota bacterium]
MKTLLKVLLWLVLALVALVAIYHAEEYIRGRYLWERHLRELAVQGDSLDIRKLAPPPIPNDGNMAAAPIFAELYATRRPWNSRLGQLNPPSVTSPPGGAWRRGHREDLNLWRAAYSNDNLLAALAIYAPVLQEVEDAARRPQARFPCRYEDGFSMELPHVSALHKLARVYCLKALVELAAGQTDAALEDVRRMLRLARAVEDEPVEISLMIRAAVLQQALQPVWEGLADHRWSAESLELLQQDLVGINLLEQLDLALHGERCCIAWLLDVLPKNPSAWLGLGSMAAYSSHGHEGPSLAVLIPKGWFYINCLNMDLCFKKYILPSLDSRSLRIYPERYDTLDFVLEGYKKHPLTPPYHILEAVMLPAMKSFWIKVGVSQTAAQSAATACALERYRLAHGRYPDALAVLVPQYLAAVPSDVIGGQPLRYRLEGDGFVLYSIGWNRKDDGGQVAWTKDDKPRLDDKAGDWVWRSQPVAPR